MAENRRFPAEQDGACVYFVSEDVSRFVKVGHTTNLRRRMQHYNYTVPGETRIEGAIYVASKSDACAVELAVLSLLRSKGLCVSTKSRSTEWFKIGDADIREASDRVAAQMPDKIVRRTGLAGPRDAWSDEKFSHQPKDIHRQIHWR